jgi:hypothetical protein
MKIQKTKENQTRKRRINHLGSKIFLTIIIILLIVIVGLIFIEKGIFKKSEIKEIELRDECSLLFNNLIHSVKTEDDCKRKCNSECETQELNYKESKFTYSETTCHTCNCFCK